MSNSNHWTAEVKMDGRKERIVGFPSSILHSAQRGRFSLANN